MWHTITTGFCARLVDSPEMRYLHAKRTQLARYATFASVTSWSELARDGRDSLQRQMAGDASAPMPFIEQQLQSSSGPIIAVTDYVCAVPESVRAFLLADRSYLTLGTVGFGRSDTRAALRDYFGVDAKSIGKAAVQVLVH